MSQQTVKRCSCGIDFEKHAHEVYDAIRFRHMAGDLKRIEAHLRTIAAEARLEALEEAAELCLELPEGRYAFQVNVSKGCGICADEIRKLAEETKP